MSTKRNRIRTNSWCIDVVERPWFIDALTYVLVFAWMGWTFRTIQTQGTGPWLLGSAVVVLLTGLMLIYEQRLAYLRIGDRVVLGTREAYEPDDPGSEPSEPSEPDDWQRRQR